MSPPSWLTVSWTRFQEGEEKQFRGAFLELAVERSRVDICRRQVSAYTAMTLGGRARLAWASSLGLWPP